MSDERRYSEEEIAAIFKRASEAQEAARRQVPESEGLTLAELQQVGEEAGITPAFIARAAAAVDRTEPPALPQTILGVPISVAQTVDLPGAFRDEDWERLVVDLRETFQAAGQVRRDGSLRVWKNGNLHALIEPAASGHRLHLRTLKGSAREMLFGEVMIAALGLVMVLTAVLSGSFTLVDDNVIAVLFALGGLGALGVTTRHLVRWREERARQMEAVAARAVQRAAAGLEAAPHEAEAPPSIRLDALPEPESARTTRPSRAERTRT